MKITLQGFAKMSACSSGLLTVTPWVQVHDGHELGKLMPDPQYFALVWQRHNILMTLSVGC